MHRRARPPGYLAHQLKRPLGGAKVRSLQTEVGIDDPDQGQEWKVVPLATSCVPMMMSAPPRRFRRSFPSGRAPNRRGQTRAPPRAPRERALPLPQHPFDPRPDRGQFTLSAAMRAGCWNGSGRAALMAHQPFEEPVLHHARVTLMTADLMTAGTTERHRRVTSAVQEQERLLALAIRAAMHRAGSARPTAPAPPPLLACR